MFFRFAKSFFKKPSAKILGLSLLTTIPFVSMNSFKMNTEPTQPSVPQQSSNQSINLPVNEEYYLVVFDTNQK